MKALNYPPIKLGQLINYMEEPTEIIQIVSGTDWNRYSELPADSPLLKPFYDCEIKDMESVGADCVRVAVDIYS